MHFLDFIWRKNQCTDQKTLQLIFEPSVSLLKTKPNIIHYQSQKSPLQNGVQFIDQGNSQRGVKVESSRTPLKFVWNFLLNLTQIQNSGRRFFGSIGICFPSAIHHWKFSTIFVEKYIILLQCVWKRMTESFWPWDGI